MALPNAVQKQAKRAEQLIKENKDRNTGTPPAPAAAPANQPASPSPTPAPAAPAAAAPPAPPTPEPSPSPANEWEQRFKVLQGKYNAEVPALHSTVRELTDKVGKLQKDLETAKAAPAPQPSPDFVPSKYLKPEDEKDFDPEMVDLVRRGAREEMEANLPGLLEKILPKFLEPYLGKTLKPLQEKVETVATRVETREAREHKTEREKFFDAMDRIIEEKTRLTFDAINTNPVFLNWLTQKDPRSRRVRQELLEESVAALDAEWAASFYTDFVAENPNAVVAPSAPTITPPRSGGGEAPRPQGKTWTTSEISAFYKDVSIGRYKGREAEKQQLEIDIYAARREGRVVEG